MGKQRNTSKTSHPSQANQPQRVGRAVILDAGDRTALTEFFTKGGQVLLPLLDLVERSERAVDEVIDVVGRSTIEALLRLSAEQGAGPKEQGTRSQRDISWYGSQQGAVTLSDRTRRVAKPRLRRRGVGEGGEGALPAYERLRDGSISAHVAQLMMRGVSTRHYAPVLRQMADTVGVSKSAVRREWVEASTQALETLQTRPLGHSAT